jgi:GAF domain-containing protein
MKDAFPELAGQGSLERLDRVYREGEPFSGTEMRLELRPPGGGEAEEHYISFVYQPLRNALGSVTGIFVHGADVTEQVAARRQAEEFAAEAREAGQRLSFLAEASEVLASSLDFRQTLDNLAKLTVTYLADWCTINLKNAAGKVERVSAAHADPAMRSWMMRLQRSKGPVPELQPVLFEVLATGRPKLLLDADASGAPTVSRDPEQIELLRRIGVESVVVVPLMTRGSAVGAIFMARGPGRRPFSEEGAG